MSTADMLLPLAGITLLPPWWAFILWAGKRCENRARSVAHRVGKWRGLLALTSSKTCNKGEARAMTEAVLAQPWFKCSRSITLAQVFALGGNVVGVAELLDIRENNHDDEADPWAIPGESGLLLGRVWEVEPVACSGGRGVFAIGACAACRHVGAIEVPRAPLTCRRCKAITARAALGRPTLKVRASFGPGGELLTAAKGEA